MKRDDEDVHFPRAGCDTSGPFSRQPARPGPDGVYARTCRVGTNVRGYDALSGRSRGGSRAGLSRRVNARVNDRAWVVQCLGVVVTGGTSVPYSQSGRLVHLIAVSMGVVKKALPGDTAWTALTNNSGETPALNNTGVVFSAANVQKLWFADGVNWCYADPTTGTVEAWVATAGALPIDSENNTPRLIETWRGRTVLSGLKKAPQQVFLSRRDVPTDFDYAPASFSADQAVALQLGNEGEIGDAVRCLIPWSDDLLIIGCDHSIYVLRGDPNDGGRLDRVTDSVGTAFGRPWCKDPSGVVYFFGSRGAVYRMAPGGMPQPISTAIRQELLAVNTGEYGVSMEYDENWQGLHVFVTKLTEKADTTHYFYELPREDGAGNAWWRTEFANQNHNPLCTAVVDGNEPGDRVVVTGGWDGYVRAIDPAAVKDDFDDIESEVVIGPILTKLGDEMMLYELQAVFSDDSDDVQYAVYVGDKAETALAGTAVASGTWSAGRNLTGLIRRSGHAIFVKITGTGMWALEYIRASIATQGEVRRRGA